MWFRIFSRIALSNAEGVPICEQAHKSAVFGHRRKTNANIALAKLWDISP